MKKISLIFASTMLLAGCANKPAYNYVPQTSSFSMPPLGEIMSVNVGDHMLKQGVSVQRAVLHVLQPSEIGNYDIPSGVYQKIGEDEKFHYFQGFSGQTNFITVGLFNIPAADASLRLEKKTNKMCILRNIEFTMCGTISVKIEDEVVSDNASFQQTLIYSGKIGNTLNLGYREYSSSLARPAFNNDVVYDLSEGNIIGYKGSQIEVIEATNKKITYKVISNFTTQ